MKIGTHCADGFTDRCILTDYLRIIRDDPIRLPSALAGLSDSLICVYAVGIFIIVLPMPISI